MKCCFFILHLVKLAFCGNCDINSRQDIAAFEYQSRKIEWKKDSDLLWQWLEKQKDKNCPTLSNQEPVVTYMNCDVKINSKKGM